MKHGKGGAFYYAIVTLLLFGLAVFSGCKTGEDAERGTFEGLDPETERQILQDYWDTYIRTDTAYSAVTIHDMHINGYYGTYNGIVAVSIAGTWDEPPFRSLPYAGYDPKYDEPYGMFVVTRDNELVAFVYPFGINLVFYKDRKFINSDEVRNFLSLKECQNIAARVNGSDAFGRFEGLDAETEERILQDFINKYSDDSSLYTIYENSVVEYYGSYTGCVVLCIMGSRITTPYSRIYHQIDFSIDGIDFNCKWSWRMPFVWKDGQIYDGGDLYVDLSSGLGLREAYELNLLTSDDLQKIADQIKAIY